MCFLFLYFNSLFCFILSIIFKDVCKIVKQEFNLFYSLNCCYPFCFWFSSYMYIAFFELSNSIISLIRSVFICFIQSQSVIFFDYDQLVFFPVLYLCVTRNYNFAGNRWRQQLRKLRPFLWKFHSSLQRSSYELDCSISTVHTHMLSHNFLF